MKLFEALKELIYAMNQIFTFPIRVAEKWGETVRRSIFTGLGLAGILSYPIVALLFQASQASQSSIHLVSTFRLVLSTVIRGVGFYSFYTLLIFGACVLFNGRGKMDDFFFEIGISFFPFIPMSIIGLPFLQYFTKNYGEYILGLFGMNNLSEMMALGGILLTILFFFFWSGILSTKIIHSRLHLKDSNAALLFMVTAIPSFFAYLVFFNYM